MTIFRLDVLIVNEVETLHEDSAVCLHKLVNLMLLGTVFKASVDRKSQEFISA